MDYGALTVLAGGFAGFGCAVGGAAYGYEVAGGVEHFYQVVFLEIADYFSYANREHRGGVVGVDGLDSAVVDSDGAFGETFAVGYPALEARSGHCGGGELGANGVAFARYDVGQYVVALAVGNDYSYPLVGHLTGDTVFGYHASAAEARTLGHDVVGEVEVGVDTAYHLGAGLTRVAVVDAVDVAEYDERVAVEHGGHESRQLVVVGEHQFGHADGIVLVDNGYDAVAQHHHHAVALVEIVAARGEALLHGEHLTDVDTPVAEQVVVAVDELYLSDSRKELAGVDIVELRQLHAAQLGASASHRSRRNHDNLDAAGAEGAHLVDESRNAGDVERAVGTGQHIAAYLYGDSAIIPHFLTGVSMALMTAEVNPLCSNALIPFIVIPPGVVTLSISVCGAAPGSESMAAAPSTVAQT